MKKLLASSTITAVAFMMSVTPVLAQPMWGNDIVVMNYNDALVGNEIMVVASTGYNDAEGGDGGHGGLGNGANDNLNVGGGNQANTGGAGGKGGNGGNGGKIWTGNAMAEAYVTNAVNTNDTNIDACACPDPCYDPCYDSMNGSCHEPYPCPDDIVVDNDNSAEVYNGVMVVADTSENDADGDEGGDGGDVDNNSNSNGNQSNTGGAGGNGGNGGDGGEIRTGSAWSIADVVNVINTNITRIRR